MKGKPKGRLHCLACRSGDVLPEKTRKCPVCKSIAFYREARPGRTVQSLMPELEEPVAEMVKVFREWGGLTARRHARRPGPR